MICQYLTSKLSTIVGRARSQYTSTIAETGYKFCKNSTDAIITPVVLKTHICSSSTTRNCPNPEGTLDPCSRRPLTKTVLLYMRPLIALSGQVVKFAAYPTAVNRPATRSDLDRLKLRVSCKLFIDSVSRIIRAWVWHRCHTSTTQLKYLHFLTIPTLRLSRVRTATHGLGL